MKITETAETATYVCVKDLPNYLYLGELPKGPIATPSLNIPTLIRHQLTSHSVVSFPCTCVVSIFKFIWFDFILVYTQIICREPVWHAKVSGSDNGKLDSLALIVMSRTRIECQVASGQIGRQIQQARNLGPRVWPIARRSQFAPHSSNKNCLRCTLCSSRSESTRAQAIRVDSARPFAPLCLQVVCVCACVVLTNPQPRACTCQESQQRAQFAFRSINTQVGPVSNHTTVFAPLNSTRTQVAHQTQQNGIQGTCHIWTQ